MNAPTDISQIITSILQTAATSLGLSEEQANEFSISKPHYLTDQADAAPGFIPFNEVGQAVFELAQTNAPEDGYYQYCFDAATQAMTELAKAFDMPQGGWEADMEAAGQAFKDAIDAGKPADQAFQESREVGGDAAAEWAATQNILDGDPDQPADNFKIEMSDDAADVLEPTADVLDQPSENFKVDMSDELDADREGFEIDDDDINIQEQESGMTSQDKTSEAQENIANQAPQTLAENAPTDDKFWDTLPPDVKPDAPEETTAAREADGGKEDGIFGKGGGFPAKDDAQGQEDGIFGEGTSFPAQDTDQKDGLASSKTSEAKPKTSEAEENYFPCGVTTNPQSAEEGAQAGELPEAQPQQEGIIDVGDLPDGVVEKDGPDSIFGKGSTWPVKDQQDGIIDVGDLPDGVAAVEAPVDDFMKIDGVADQAPEENIIDVGDLPDGILAEGSDTVQAQTDDFIKFDGVADQAPEENIIDVGDLPDGILAEGSDTVQAQTDDFIKFDGVAEQAPKENIIDVGDLPDGVVDANPSLHGEGQSDDFMKIEATADDQQNEVFGVGNSFPASKPQGENFDDYEFYDVAQKPEDAGENFEISKPHYVKDNAENLQATEIPGVQEDGITMEMPQVAPEADQEGYYEEDGDGLVINGSVGVEQLDKSTPKIMTEEPRCQEVADAQTSENGILIDGSSSITDTERGYLQDAQTAEIAVDPFMCGEARVAQTSEQGYYEDSGDGITMEMPSAAPQAQQAEGYYETDEDGLVANSDAGITDGRPYPRPATEEHHDEANNMLDEQCVNTLQDVPHEAGENFEISKPHYMTDGQETAENGILIDGSSSITDTERGYLQDAPVNRHDDGTGFGTSENITVSMPDVAPDQPDQAQQDLAQIDEVMAGPFNGVQQDVFNEPHDVANVAGDTHDHDPFNCPNNEIGMEADMVMQQQAQHKVEQVQHDVHQQAEQHNVADHAVNDIADQEPPAEAGGDIV